MPHPAAPAPAPSAPSAAALPPLASSADSGTAASSHVSPEQLRELHLLWSRVQAGAWRTLALVPADAQGSGLEVGTGLVQAARLFGAAAALQLVDARGLAMQQAAELTGQLAARVAAGERVLVVADSPLANAATLALMQAVDAALLCAQRGMDLARAQQTLQLCGRERFLGSVLLPAPR